MSTVVVKLRNSLTKTGNMFFVAVARNEEVG